MQKSMSDMFVEDDASFVDYSSPLSIEDGTVNNIAMSVNSTPLSKQSCYHQAQCISPSNTYEAIKTSIRRHFLKEILVVNILFLTKAL